MHGNLPHIPPRKKKKKFVGQVGESAEMTRKIRVTAFTKKIKKTLKFNWLWASKCWVGRGAKNQNLPATEKENIKEGGLLVDLTINATQKFLKEHFRTDIKFTRYTFWTSVIVSWNERWFFTNIAR